MCFFFIRRLQWMEGSLYLFSTLLLSVRVDHYSWHFLETLRLIRSVVMVWSKYYMKREHDHNRFVLLMIAFIFRIGMIIIFSNMFITLIGWDCLGATSFLLVIFYKNRKRLGSGIITALTNRIGDCFLLCLLGFYFMERHLLWLRLLIIMSITKRAQFPFSRWLPAAMAAPTPVSALVHSSTLVTAGVYMMIRYCHLDSRLMIWIGRFTILLAGLSACTERDLKKVVALRTLSQLGVIMIALGAGEKSYCFFHIISHACFKALIFLCVGTSLHTVYGTQDRRSFNKNYTLFVTFFLIASILSLLGLIFTSGYYRKDSIFEMTYKAYSWAVLCFLLGIRLTTCYSVKILTLLFGVKFTLNRSNIFGGLSWSVKMPVYTLGFYSFCYGKGWITHRLLIPMNFFGRGIPLFCIFVGGFIGFKIKPVNDIFLRRIITLIPNTQHLAGKMTRLQSIDKGWLDAKRYSFFHSFLIEHYTPLISIGIRILLIWIYGKYSQCSIEMCC